MGRDIDCLHHVGLAVADLDEATALYERLGFQLTPRSYHEVAAKEGEPPKPLGTANVTATFPRNFVELVAHVRDDMPDRIIGPAFLSRFEGLHILTFNTPDADAVEARLTAAKMGHGQVSTLSREVETEEGPRMMRVRDVILGAEDQDEVKSWSQEGLPEGRVQVVENLTPEYLLQERHQAHANGAVDLVDSILCVEAGELPDYERRYATYLDREAVDGGPGRVFRLDEGAKMTLIADHELDALLPGEVPPASPAFVAFDVAVADLGAAQRLIEGNGFTIKATGDGRIFVPAAEALGGAVIFSER